MAIPRQFLANTLDYDPTSKISFEFEEYAIGGKLVTSQVFLDSLNAVQVHNDTILREKIRKDLTTALVNRILTSNMVEVTEKYDPIQDGYLVSARLYLAPNSEVKVLRRMKK